MQINCLRDHAITSFIPCVSHSGEPRLPSLLVDDWALHTQSWSHPLLPINLWTLSVSLSLLLFQLVWKHVTSIKFRIKICTKLNSWDYSLKQNVLAIDMFSSLLFWPYFSRLWKMRPSSCLLVAYTSWSTICLSCLTLLDCGFLCSGLSGWIFPLRSEGYDFMDVLECLISVLLTEN